MASARYRSRWWRVFETVVLIAAVAGAVYLRAKVLLPARVTSNSMAPTLLAGDYVLIYRLAYRNRLPQPGDIIAFHTVEHAQVWIKRVVAGPGDHVYMRSGVLFRNGKPVFEPYIAQRRRPNFLAFAIPSEHVFVLGDNRDNSDDSRYWGPLHQRFVLGKVVVVYWPWYRLGRPNGPAEGNRHGANGKQ